MFSDGKTMGKSWGNHGKWWKIKFYPHFFGCSFGGKREENEGEDLKIISQWVVGCLNRWLIGAPFGYKAFNRFIDRLMCSGQIKREIMFVIWKDGKMFDSWFSNSQVGHPKLSVEVTPGSYIEFRRDVWESLTLRCLGSGETDKTPEWRSQSIFHVSVGWKISEECCSPKSLWTKHKNWGFLQ